MRHDEYDSLIKAAVVKHLPYYDWRLYKAQLWQESKFQPNAVSPAGAEGIAQFTSLTWEDWSGRAGFPTRKRSDPEASIFTGAMYMDSLIGKWTAPRPDLDKWCLAMASYNAGFGHILKAQKLAGDSPAYSSIINRLVDVTGPKHSKETRDYVRNILNYWSVQIVEGGL